MVREIMRDVAFLKIPSAPACAKDASIADDLCDTLRAHIDGCVGMAANMIGVSVRIIVFLDGNRICEMFNPQILRRDGAYETEEGCLSLTGARKTKRYRTIKVQFKTRDGKTRIKSYSGFTAQIIQHEIDHLEGMII